MTGDRNTGTTKSVKPVPIIGSAVYGVHGTITHMIRLLIPALGAGLLGVWTWAIIATIKEGKSAILGTDPGGKAWTKTYQRLGLTPTTIRNEDLRKLAGETANGALLKTSGAWAGKTQHTPVVVAQLLLYKGVRAAPISLVSLALPGQKWTVTRDIYGQANVEGLGVADREIVEALLEDNTWTWRGDGTNVIGAAPGWVSGHDIETILKTGVRLGEYLH